MLSQSDLSFKENKESSVSQIVNPESIFKMFITTIDQINDKNEVTNFNLSVDGLPSIVPSSAEITPQLLNY
jgi:hypothetical protein